jgi:DDE domain
VKVAGQWRYVYRAIDQFGQVIDVFVSPQRDASAARRFFERAIDATRVTPSEVVTDRAPTYPMVLDELLPAAWHCTDQYANNRIEADHGVLKSRLRPMRGLQQDRNARVIIVGHAFCETFAEATTSWRSRSRRIVGWPSRSQNWHSCCRTGDGSAEIRHALRSHNATDPSRLLSILGDLAWGAAAVLAERRRRPDSPPEAVPDASTSGAERSASQLDN